MRRLVPILAVVVGACYSYVGVGGLAPSEGTDVRLELASPRDVALQDVTVHDITIVQGRLLASSADSIALAVTRLWGLEGRSYEATGIGVSLPRTGIAAERAKRVSPVRSGLAIATGGAGVVAIIFSVGQLVGSGGGTQPKPMP